MFRRSNVELEHERKQELELVRCWRDVSDDKKSDELGYEPKDELDLARCWRNAPNPSMNGKHLEMLRKQHWIDNNSQQGDPDDDLTSRPVSMSESMHGYFFE